MMVYVAARFSKRERVRGVYDLLLAAGHKISCDWTIHERTINGDGASGGTQRAVDQAGEDLDGVGACTAFILLAEPAMRGALVELGAALALHKLVYVVDAAYDNIFYYHPGIIHCDSVEEAIAMLSQGRER